MENLRLCPLHLCCVYHGKPIHLFPCMVLLNFLQRAYPCTALHYIVHLNFTILHLPLRAKCYVTLCCSVWLHSTWRPFAVPPFVVLFAHLCSKYNRSWLPPPPSAALLLFFPLRAYWFFPLLHCSTFASVVSTTSLVVPASIVSFMIVMERSSSQLKLNDIWN